MFKTTNLPSKMKCITANVRFRLEIRPTSYAPWSTKRECRMLDLILVYFKQNNNGIAHPGTSAIQGQRMYQWVRNVKMKYIVAKPRFRLEIRLTSYAPWST